MSCTSNRILFRPLFDAILLRNLNSVPSQVRLPSSLPGPSEHLYVLCVCVCVCERLHYSAAPSPPAPPPTPPGSVPTRGCELTGHVHHAAVAQSQHLVGLAEQAAGADAVRVVAGELLLAGGAAVPPGLGQVGQLNTGVC